MEKSGIEISVGLGMSDVDSQIVDVRSDLHFHHQLASNNAISSGAINSGAATLRKPKGVTLDFENNQRTQRRSARPGTSGNASSRQAFSSNKQLSSQYGLAKVNNYSLKERQIMRATFAMTPKQVSRLQRTLKRDPSPNRHDSLIPKGFALKDIAKKAQNQSAIREKFGNMNSQMHRRSHKSGAGVYSQQPTTACASVTSPRHTSATHPRNILSARVESAPSSSPNNPHQDYTIFTSAQTLQEKKHNGIPSRTHSFNLQQKVNRQRHHQVLSGKQANNNIVGGPMVVEDFGSSVGGGAGFVLTSKSQLMGSQRARYGKQTRTADHTSFSAHRFVSSEDTACDAQQQEGVAQIDTTGAPFSTQQSSRVGEASALIVLSGGHRDQKSQAFVRTMRALPTDNDNKIGNFKMGMQGATIASPKSQAVYQTIGSPTAQSPSMAQTMLTTAAKKGTGGRELSVQIEDEFGQVTPQLYNRGALRKGRGKAKGSEHEFFSPQRIQRQLIQTNTARSQLRKVKNTSEMSSKKLTKKGGRQGVGQVPAEGHDSGKLSLPNSSRKISLVGASQTYSIRRRRQQPFANTSRKLSLGNHSKSPRALEVQRPNSTITVDSNDLGAERFKSRSHHESPDVSPDCRMGIDLGEQPALSSYRESIEKRLMSPRKTEIQKRTEDENQSMIQAAQLFRKKIEELKERRAEALGAPNSINPTKIIDQNNALMIKIQTAICTSMATDSSKLQAEPKRIYDFKIRPCGAIYFEINIKLKQSPLCIQVIRDQTERVSSSDKAPLKQDFMMYTSKLTTTPSPEDFEQAFSLTDKEMRVYAEESLFEANKFSIGLYSMSGTTVRFAYAFGTEPYPCISAMARKVLGQKELDSRQLAKQQRDKEKKQEVEAWLFAKEPEKNNPGRFRKLVSESRQLLTGNVYLRERFQAQCESYKRRQKTEYQKLVNERETKKIKDDRRADRLSGDAVFTSVQAKQQFIRTQKQALAQSKRKLKETEDHRYYAMMAQRTHYLDWYKQKQFEGARKQGYVRRQVRQWITLATFYKMMKILFKQHVKDYADYTYLFKLRQTAIKLRDKCRMRLKSLSRHPEMRRNRFSSPPFLPKYVDSLNKDRLRYSITFLARNKLDKTEDRARSVIRQFLKDAKDGRQLLLTFRNFIQKIVRIQQSVKSQIRMFAAYEKDISDRMQISIGQIVQRMSENKQLKKLHPNFVRELVAIEPRHKQEAINSLLQMYRFQHTLQIIRYLNNSRACFNKDTYLSILGALAQYVIAENKQLERIKKLSTQTQLINQMLADKKTQKTLRNVDSESVDRGYSHNFKVVDQSSSSFKNFFSIIQAARTLSNHEAKIQESAMKEKLLEMKKEGHSESNPEVRQPIEESRQGGSPSREREQQKESTIETDSELGEVRGQKSGDDEDQDTKVKTFKPEDIGEKEALKAKKQLESVNDEAAMGYISLTTSIERIKLSMQQVDQQILDDCSLIGITLPDFDKNALPRFSMPFSKLNYGALISKAFYLYRKENLIVTRRKTTNRLIQQMSFNSSAVLHQSQTFRDPIIYLSQETESDESKSRATGNDSGLRNPSRLSPQTRLMGAAGQSAHRTPSSFKAVPESISRNEGREVGGSPGSRKGKQGHAKKAAR